MSEEDEEIQKQLEEYYRPKTSEETKRIREEQAKNAKILKKAEFRNYLDEKGLMKILTEILMIFYEETDRPSPPEDFIRDYFSKLNGVDIKIVNKENEELQEQIEAAKAKLYELTHPSEEEEDEKK